MLLPGFPSLFRTSKPQQFDYKPIYYDEEKEEREKRTREAGDDSKVTGHSTIKFRSRGSRASVRTNLRIIVLVILLSALAIYIITY